MKMIISKKLNKQKMERWINKLLRKINRNYKAEYLE